MENLQIEVVLRKGTGELDLSNFQSVIDNFLAAELDDKIVLDFPLEWIGFRDGTMTEMFKYFGEKIYVALAYFSHKSEFVTDSDGEPIIGYETVIDGRRIEKFVKKRLRIINIIDPDKNVFEAKEYVLETRVSPPVVKILDVYSGAVDSGIKLSQFLSGNRR